MPFAEPDELRHAAHPMRRAGDGVGLRRQSVALTPVERTARPASISSTARPDASFVAHVMAMAEQSPQTRVLRRAAIADVESAYARAADRGRTPAPGHVAQRMA